MIRKKEYLALKKNDCEQEFCENKAFGIITQRFLCQHHYEEIKPPKNKEYLAKPSRGLVGVNR